MDLDRLFKSRIGIILLSIIWGLGVACIFSIGLKNTKYFVNRGPPIKATMDQYFNYGTKKCYQYQPVLTGGEPPPPLTPSLQNQAEHPSPL